MTKCLTISKLTYEIFIKAYLDKPIAYINDRSIYQEIKSAYHGGITDNGENLIYLDLNSLYCYVSLNDMPGIYCSKVEYIDKTANLDDCNIKAPKNNYIGVLPVRI
jgi:hypothetical protein